MEDAGSTADGSSVPGSGKLLTLRVRCEKNNNQVLRDVSEDEKLSVFFRRVSDLTEIPMTNMVLKAGFPPKKLVFNYKKSVKSLGLSPQDTLIAEHSDNAEEYWIPRRAPAETTEQDYEDDDITIIESEVTSLGEAEILTNADGSSALNVASNVPITSANYPAPYKNTPSPKPSLPMKESATNTPGEQESDVIDLVGADETTIITGILLRRAIPSDNSCLFSSVIFGLSGSTKSNSVDTTHLRNIIADAVASNPEHYNEIFLGKPNKEYQTWIKHDKSWGGAIELAILAEYYEIEIAIMNIQGHSINVFGEDMNYDNRIYLIYDGIHYDCLMFEPFNGSPPQTIFSKDDQEIYSQAMEMGKEAFNSKQYTNVDNFTLICVECHQICAGARAANEHTILTGHKSFEEKVINPSELPKS